MSVLSDFVYLLDMEKTEWILNSSDFPLLEKTAERKTRLQKILKKKINENIALLSERKIGKP